MAVSFKQDADADSPNLLSLSLWSFPPPSFVFLSCGIASLGQFRLSPHQTVSCAIGHDDLIFHRKLHRRKVMAENHILTRKVNHHQSGVRGQRWVGMSFHRVSARIDGRHAVQNIVENKKWRSCSVSHQQQRADKHQQDS